jgi:hypothetical protein
MRDGSRPRSAYHGATRTTIAEVAVETTAGTARKYVLGNHPEELTRLDRQAAAIVEEIQHAAAVVLMPTVVGAWGYAPVTHG